MATTAETIQFISDQSGLGRALTWRKMFGEYALYLNGKVVAFVCDNQLFMKPTDAGRALLGTPAEAPPYPGAKLYFLLQDELDNRDLLRDVFWATEASLPLPKTKSAAKKAQAPQKVLVKKGKASP
jgi:TfoX/Sxy family transcriptional regulator of competence genes